MKCVPYGQLITVGMIREYFARNNNADFTDPITAGIFYIHCSLGKLSENNGETPYWRTLKVHGELNPKYPGRGWGTEKIAGVRRACDCLQG